MKRMIITLMLLRLTAIGAIAAGIQTPPIKGVIKDATTGETLIGVTVLVLGTDTGAYTDSNGYYEIHGLQKGTYQLEVRYIFYKTVRSEPITFNSQEVVLDFELQAEDNELETIFVSAKANKENETTLLSVRKTAPAAIENMGAKEMSLKGISNVEDGLKKISGISFQESGQLLVRGLGDRYSTSTLNGLPIASPNPDNKLIPLNLFSTSTVENITVSKTYVANAYADYSGAHIDISTKGNSGGDIFSVSFATGGMIGTTFGRFYQSDKAWGLWKSNRLSVEMKQMSSSDFSTYIKQEDPFNTSFSIKDNVSLPVFSASAIYGHEWKVGNKGNSVNLTASFTGGNQRETIRDSYIANLTAQGDTLNEFSYDGYTSHLDLSGIMNLGYNFRKNHNIAYTLFYARNASDNFKLREGHDSEGIHLIGSNSVAREYSLLNNQLTAYHKLGNNWDIDWGASFGMTRSLEPDRRQVMFRKDDGNITLFKLNQQETMRYFGELQEREGVASINSKYLYWNDSALRFGLAYKNKNRDFSSIRYYYSLRNINPEITDVLNTDSFLNQNNISNGNIGVKKDAQPKSQYFAESGIICGYLETDLKPANNLLINIGVRYEYAKQWVKYWNDASSEKRSNLNGSDFFPALNIKYSINQRNTLRLATSRTITRPSFIEMAPFLYKESYGSAEIRGNRDIKNGYNYNFDIRYELNFADSKDLLSVTAYYKKLRNPIEQVQESSGGSAVYTFRNANSGSAMGFELEFKKKLLPVLRFNFNASFIFTNVLLPEDGGIYTETERALQGASPYLANADLCYIQPLKQNSELSLTLLYNLQGPRIYAVGIFGMGDIIQEPLHTLDFVVACKINENWSLKLQGSNLLNSTMEFTQKIKSTLQNVEVQRYHIGNGIKIGITYKL